MGCFGIAVACLLFSSLTAVSGLSLQRGPRSRARTACIMSASSEPLLVRAYRGEEVDRTPVWLMRQAGRYMADFRKYSEKFKFRERSETPEIAIELSLQPWRRFGVDGVIMFSGESALSSGLSLRCPLICLLLLLVVWLRRHSHSSASAGRGLLHRGGEGAEVREAHSYSRADCSGGSDG